LDWVSEGCYTCYYFFFIFCYWWHNSLFCCKRGGLGVVGAQRLSITSWPTVIVANPSANWPMSITVAASLQQNSSLENP
jgi:hypothetical protein